MSSFLDDCEWQQRLGETVTATTNLTDTDTDTDTDTSSDGLLLPSPCCVGSFSCYGSENDVSPVVAATAAATSTTTTTIKSEQVMMLDDENNIDDETGTCSRYSHSNYSYNNYGDDDDFDSSDDEAIIYHMKMAAKKKQRKKNPPPSPDDVTSVGNDLVSASTTITVANTAPNTSKVVDKHSSTSHLLRNGCEDGMVASISPDGDDDDDNDGDDDIALMARQRSAGTKRKRNKKNLGNTTVSYDNGNASTNAIGNASANTVYSAKRTCVVVYGYILFSSSLPVISCSQATPDMRFRNNEEGGGGGGAVSGTASCANTNNGVEPALEQRLGPRNTKTAKSTNISAYNGSFIRNNASQGNTERSSKDPTKWESKFQQLVDFKEKFRHTNVPQRYAENKPLATWVAAQRTQYKLRKARKMSSKRREQIQLLEQLGFEWEVRSYNWEERHRQLADFKEKFRHTNVPHMYAENKPLGSWVGTQRAQYKLFKANKNSSMTRERVQSLDELGFEWEIQAYTWEEQRQQLADFKEKFRHSNVPSVYAENKPLGSWVRTQRKEYKLFKAGKKSSMRRERIRSLEELDFEWEVSARSSRNTWGERRQQLVVFKDKFLHTNVPHKYAENKPLATWVTTQRTQYKLLRANKKSNMTRKRIQSLDELGFEWQPKSGRSSTQDGYESDTTEMSLII